MEILRLIMMSVKRKHVLTAGIKGSLLTTTLPTEIDLFILEVLISFSNCFSAARWVDTFTLGSCKELTAVPEGDKTVLSASVVFTGLSSVSGPGQNVWPAVLSISYFIFFISASMANMSLLNILKSFTVSCPSLMNSFSWSVLSVIFSIASCSDRFAASAFAVFK